ncbi:MAG: hypothetical protein KJ726_06945, partial [Verrucomicrobia bacterium]|nr:hypothetical protein [Verrucomicrobiota bacterium]
FNIVANTAAWAAISADALTDNGVDLEPYLGLARRLRAETLVVCSVAREGAGRSIYARVIDPQDGEILFVDDVYSETLEDALPYHVAGLANKIERRFPLFRGEIVKAFKRQFTIDKGAKDGVRTKAKVIVMAPPLANEETGAVRMADGLPVELLVTRAARDCGVAELTRSGAKEIVKEGDIVFAR